jgi:hypothetical protein
METSTRIFQLRSTADLIAVPPETRDHMIDHPSQCVGGLNVPGRRYLRSCARVKFFRTSDTSGRDPFEVAIRDNP